VQPRMGYSGAHGSVTRARFTAMAEHLRHRPRHHPALTLVEMGQGHVEESREPLPADLHMLTLLRAYYSAADPKWVRVRHHRLISEDRSTDMWAIPEHGEALADRLEAFIAASTPTPAASVVHLRRS